MLQVLFSWVIIASAALIFGKAITDTLYRERLQIMGHPDIYLMTGIIFLNVYAQFFSLFYKVAGIACTLLGMVGIIMAVIYAYRCFRIGGKKNLFPGLSQERVACWRWVVFAFCVLLTILWDIREPTQYDTGLYHAQAIRWIEEYAVVPGLGNLHMRLAYNSAFMCLQALFSLEWLVGQSLHTLNGFFCLAALAYVCFTVRNGRNGSWQVSDLLKIIMLIFVVQKRYDISSSGTDIWTMLLVLYIFVKWSEYIEGEEKDGSLYGYLALISAYVMTVKLSGASVVALALYPLCLFLKKRDFQFVFIHAAGVLFILFPWLIRNVIISGFLIYPLDALDIFYVDWKMDPAVVKKDSLLIKMYARGTPKQEDFDLPFGDWICKWFLQHSMGERILILLGVACVPLILYLLWRGLKEKNLPKVTLLGVALLNTVFWFITAPAIRFGGPYIYILIAVTLGDIDVRCIKKVCAVTAIVAFGVSVGLYVPTLPRELQEVRKYLYKQPDYINRVATQYPLGNVQIWMPDEGDMVGYWTFPATPNAGQFQTLKLRGEGFQEGFLHE